MITNLHISGFKSLADVRLSPGALNLFIGANAGGKSNFFDALRVLQGIGYGFSIEEIFDGKPKSARSDVWEPIRGGSGYAHFMDGGTSRAPIRFEVGMRFDRDGTPVKTLEYSIALSAVRGAVVSESLVVDSQPVFETVGEEERPQPMNGNLSGSFVHAVRYHRSGRGRKTVKMRPASEPMLHFLRDDPACEVAHREAMDLCIKVLSDMQRIDPRPAILREYSQAHRVDRLGEQGENFAALVKGVLVDKRSRVAYLSWLQELTPSEIEDVVILSGALGEPLFAVKENGREYPAPILSDGTLRFAAIAAAFFQPDLPGIATIEEIENGIHPSRLRLLVELLKSRAEEGMQVMATTHSPMLLAWLEERDYATTFFCKRDEETGASLITPLENMPHFMEVIRTQSIAELFAEGWFEGTS